MSSKGSHKFIDLFLHYSIPPYLNVLLHSLPMLQKIKTRKQRKKRCQVVNSGLHIWNHASYCELKEPAPEPTEAPMKKMKVVNCQSYVNLRAEATAKFESLAQLTLGTEVEATGNVFGGFIEVIYMGMKGFVAKDYLAEQK